MTASQRIYPTLLVALLIAAGLAWWRTAPPTARVSRQRAAQLAAAEIVDQSTFTTAQHLARLADTPDEERYAQAALRVADHAVDAAFATALRDVEAHPPDISPKALGIQEHVRKTQALVDADQKHVTALTTQLAQAKDAQKGALQDELDLAQSQLDLDKDEMDEANQELLRAGGNLQQRIEALQQEHDAEEKARSAAPTATAQAPAVVQHGSWSRYLDWQKLRQKRQDIDYAADTAAKKASDLDERRTALASVVEKSKSEIAGLAHPTIGTTEPATAPAPAA